MHIFKHSWLVCRLLWFCLQNSVPHTCVDNLLSQGEFVEDGTETHFAIGDGIPAYIKAVSSGKRKSGIIHSLFINNAEIPLATEWNYERLDFLYFTFCSTSCNWVKWHWDTVYAKCDNVHITSLNSHSWVASSTYSKRESSGIIGTGLRDVPQKRQKHISYLLMVMKHFKRDLPLFVYSVVFENKILHISLLFMHYF